MAQMVTMGQQSFHYLATVRDRWFAVTVVCLGALTVGLVAAVLFAH